MIRDALWAAINRANNAATFVDSHQDVVKQDIFQIRQLLDQCHHVAPAAISEGSLRQDNWESIAGILAQVEDTIGASGAALNASAKLLEQALALLEA